MGIRTHAKKDHVELGSVPGTSGTVIGHVGGMLGRGRLGKAARIVSGGLLRAGEVLPVEPGSCTRSGSTR